MYKKARSIILALVIALTALTAVSNHFYTTTAYGTYDDENNMIIQTYSFTNPTFTPVTLYGETFTRVEMEGCQLYGNANEPRLPVKPLKILLPQGTAVKNIVVEPSGEQEISMGGLAPIELGVGAYRLDQDPPNEPPVPSYDETSLYPGSLFMNLGVQHFRGYGILILNLQPVQYLGSTHTIRYYQQMTLKVELKQASVNPLYRGLPEDQREVLNKVDTPISSVLESYEIDETPRFSSYDYVIITTNDFKNYHGTYDFDDLIDQRESQGLTCTYKTVESIYDEYDGVDHQEQIRNFIKDAYLNWGTTWVLLAGDVEFVPIRYLYDIDGGDGTLTSDIYYQCLDGNYNDDGDGYWGEKFDGVDGGWIDLYAEVYVGRASVDCYEQIENFVKKTLEYENSDWGSDVYLEEVASVGEYVWSGAGGWGAGYVELCIDNHTDYGQDTHGIPSNVYTITELYERDMNPDWSKQDIMNEINDGLNYINHLGHASPTSCMKLSPSDIASLTNTEYSMWYSQGCHPGELQAADECIAEAWTVYEHGGFAAIMNTGYGYGSGSDYDGPDNRYAREFFDALYYPEEAISRIGVANQDSKEDNIWHVNESYKYMYHVYYSTELFGDPYVQIKGAEDFGADFDWGPDYPRTNEPVYFIDRSMGDESRDWDFGDGSHSSSRNPSHVYTNEGVYNVTLTIWGGGETDSCTKQVEVWDNWPPHVIATPEFYAGNNP
ncbi:MAG TPA: PKD domain-containing protein, partial [Thermoplasmatales archaeon]|nr:PKD domain-containing protein [Thermoplasmatales archaeon]